MAHIQFLKFLLIIEPLSDAIFLSSYTKMRQKINIGLAFRKYIHFPLLNTHFYQKYFTI